MTTRIMNEEYEEIPVIPSDYIARKYYLDKEKRMKVKLGVKAPKNLSNTMKGKVGELTAKIILDANRIDDDNIIVLQKPGHAFDILDIHNNIRYEVKYSPLHSYGGTKEWIFYLSTNKPGRTAKRISETKYMKDYKDCSDFLLLVGIDEDFTFKLFMIPTDSPDLKSQCKITIPHSCQGKYSKYLVDLDNFSSKLPRNSIYSLLQTY